MNRTVARVLSATTIGLEPQLIEVEVDCHRSLPGLVIIGLPARNVAEAKERLSASLRHCGVRLKSLRTVVNLAPAELKKTSSGVELAIAVGILQLYGEIPPVARDTLFLGELSLDGSIRAVRGALPIVRAAARRFQLRHVYLPQANQAEVAYLKDIQLHPINSLQQLLPILRHQHSAVTLKPVPFTSKAETTLDPFLNLPGHQAAKRALSIAAAGGHHVLLVGPPGTGKTALSQALPSLLPPLTLPEALELTELYSISGHQLDSLITRRPFRQPHYSVSSSQLLGSTHSLMPGEISLAHQGVLFLDEFTEFQRYQREALRLPIESGSVTLSHHHTTVRLPAACIVVAACNPCACGWWGSQQQACRCSKTALQLYQRRLSGPMLDRFDLQLFMTPEPVVLTPTATTTEQPTLQQHIQEARAQQHQRYQELGYQLNAQLPGPLAVKAIELEHKSRKLLQHAQDRWQLSPRAVTKVLKVSRTIADLEKNTTVTEEHVAEALQYRQTTWLAT